MSHSSRFRRSGFTLAEILLAMLVFAIAISTILALLARSIETADEILLKDEAINLSSALDAYMSELPFYESGNPLNAYSLVAGTGRGVVYAYQFRATTNTDRGDGTPNPFTGDVASSTIGEDYFVTPAIRDPVNQADEVSDDMPVRNGRLFYVRLSESPANPFTIQNGIGNLPSNPNTAGTNGFPVYDSAVLVIFAEFFVIPVDGVVPATGIDPVFSFNFAVRR